MTCAEWLKQQGMQQGMQQGREQGFSEGKLALARELIKEGFDTSTIARAASMSERDLTKVAVEAE